MERIDDLTKIIGSFDGGIILMEGSVRLTELGQQLLVRPLRIDFNANLVRPALPELTSRLAAGTDGTDAVTAMLRIERIEEILDIAGLVVIGDAQEAFGLRQLPGLVEGHAALPDQHAAIAGSPDLVEIHGTEIAIRRQAALRCDQVDQGLSVRS